MGEPSCFACGWYDEDVPTYPHVTIAAAWEKSHLQRAHVIPRTAGGSSRPWNIVLLCADCHAKSPDFAASPVPMLEWIRRRRRLPPTGSLFERYFVDVPRELGEDGMRRAAAARKTSPNAFAANIQEQLQHAHLHQGRFTVSTIVEIVRSATYATTHVDEDPETDGAEGMTP
jgi:hypothetical protein